MKTIAMKTNFKLNPLFFACLFVGAQFSGLNLITNEAKAQTTNNQGSSANQTFKTEREDFSNSQDYDRNLKGECDSTCDLVPPYVPPF